MYNKQDSVFWWTLDDYVKDNPKFKNLTIERKSLIEQGFRLAYYGLFQYQLYIGRELNTIEPSNVQEIANYILDNFDSLYLTVYKSKNKKALLELKTEEDKKEFLELLETLIIPYINDHSFSKINGYKMSKHSLTSLVMQLLFKNKYDINYKNKDNLDKLYYSPLYPYLLTLLIIDPTDTENMYSNVSKFFTKERIEEAYNNGRMITKEEDEYLSSNLDNIRNDEDFSASILNFSEEKWLSFDLKTRFRLIFQLSKYTSIILKEGIGSLTMLEDGNNIYDLIEFYLPIILRSPEELSKISSNEESMTWDNQKDYSFLYPISVKDFDPNTILEYYKDMKITKIKLDKDKLFAFAEGITFALSKMRLINQLLDNCSDISDFFIDEYRIALINSLKLFNKKATNHYCSDIEYFYRLDDVFIDSTTLSNLIKDNKNIKDDFKINDRLKNILMTISYLISLNPEIVKKMDYSLEEIIKYYLVCFGPYKKTKLGYDKFEIKALTTIIKKIDKHFEKIKDLKNDEYYYSTIYLIDKLINFDKK